jgi:hypothetical protein
MLRKYEAVVMESAGGVDAFPTAVSGSAFESGSVLAVSAIVWAISARNASEESAALALGALGEGLPTSPDPPTVGLPES